MKLFTFKSIVSFKFLFTLAGTFISLAAMAQPVVTLTAPSAASTTISTGGTVSFTAERNGNNANWTGGNGNFTYTWNVVSGPAGGLTFSPASTTITGNNSSTTGTFTINGTYTVSCTVSEGGGLTATSGIKTVVVLAPPPPAVSISPNPTASTFTGGTVSFTSSVSNFTGTGTITYTWSVSPGTNGVDYIIPAGNSSSKNIVFNSVDVYSVSVVASRGTESATSATTTVNVFQPNLYSTSGTGTVKAYRVNSVTGAILNGPADVFTPSGSTAGLGKNKANVNDANGNLYYILNTSSNNGVVQIYSVTPSGSGNVSVGSIDMNGTGDNTSLGFVRLGFDGTGKGWIIAGDGASAIYIASFQGNGSNPISNINTYGNAPLSVNGGLASEFQNGDLAISGTGVLYAMANVTGGDTYIYTLNSLLSPTTLNKKWTVQTAGGVFTGTSVNGVAWTQTGSLHISTGNGIYFIDQTTANQVSGTVQAVLINSFSGLTDLASSEFPANTSLPISYGEIKVRKEGSNAELSWTTLSEINNDYFVVERSTDGIRFVQAGIVDGKGNTGTKENYSFTDPLSTTAKVLYYRLRQVDADGKATISSVVSLRLNGTKLNNYAVYPNPFVSDIKLQIETDKQQEITVRISNASGQLVMSKKVILQLGDNIVVLQNLESLKTGIYMVELVGADWKHTQRISKQ